MRFQRLVALLAFLVTFLTPCFAHHMAVVVDKDNDVGNVTAAHLSRIFRAEIKKWPDGKTVVLVLHKDSVGENETLQRLIKMSPSELKTANRCPQGLHPVGGHRCGRPQDRAIHSRSHRLGGMSDPSTTPSTWCASTANCPWNRAICRIRLRAVSEGRCDRLCHLGQPDLNHARPTARRLRPTPPLLPEPSQ